ncbi:MAG: alpha-amylase family glycosyl hydrolase [Candidatus Levyibacteriota bacterium]
MLDLLVDHLKQIYSQEDISIIQRELFSYIQTLPQYQKKQKPNENWYEYANFYVVYPDSFFGDKKPLENFLQHLSYIKNLGINAIHILPFLDSPMKDRGFDVQNYFRVRKELGSITDIKKIKRQAKELGLHLFMDLVFNHVSNQHEWFVKAVNGDAFYRNYFIHTKEKPQFLRTFKKNAAVWAEYLYEGEKTSVSVAFPEFAGEIPHWIRGKDGYWYYHTYYPHQLDVDWKNPNIFLEFAKVLIFWTTVGFNFRVDAVPFIGKSAYKQTNVTNDFAHHLISGMQYIAKEINPECSFILETYEKLETVIEYFGRENLTGAQMLYGFHLCTHLWVGIIEKNTSYIWAELEKIQHIPITSQWIQFLRNHDELSLAYLDESLVKDVGSKLLPFGRSFREGYGVAGRTFSFLQKNEQRFYMAYLLLFSMPKGVLIPYGDELGKENISDSALSSDEKIDARNINRGCITEEEIASEKGKRIVTFLSGLLGKRQRLRELLNTWPKKIIDDNEIFAASYETGNKKLIIFINLTDKKKIISFISSNLTVITSVNTVNVTDKSIKLDGFAGVWLQTTY